LGRLGYVMVRSIQGALPGDGCPLLNRVGSSSVVPGVLGYVMEGSVLGALQGTAFHEKARVCQAWRSDVMVRGSRVSSAG